MTPKSLLRNKYCVSSLEDFNKNNTFHRVLWDHAIEAGQHADAQYLFTEDVCGYGKNHKPRHGKMYRNFAPELERLQSERIAAFKEFKADVDQGGYPGAEHSVAIQDDEFDAFMKKVQD